MRLPGLDKKEKVAELLKDEKIREQASAYNNGALNIAALNGHDEIVSLLLTVDSVKENVNDNEALKYALLNNHTKVIKRLFQEPKLKQKFNHEVFMSAVTNGNLDLLNLFLSDDATKSLAAANDNYALFNAAKNGKLDIVQLLLTVPAVKEKAAKEGTVVRAALQNGHVEIAKELIKIPEVAQTIPFDVFTNACTNGQVDVVKFLLTVDSIRNNVAAANNQPLRKAVSNGRFEIVKLLLKESTVRREGLDLKAVAPTLRKLDFEALQLIGPILKVRGMPLANILKPEVIIEILTNTQYNLALLESDTKQFLASLPEEWVSPLAIPVLEIIEANKSVKDSEHAFTSNSETAMSPRTLSAADVSFNKAKELYGEKFASTGLQKIEEEIRDMILNKIAADPNTSTAARSFINLNRAELVKGNNKEKMDKAREYFNSNEDNDHVAWRAYDKWAPVNAQGWPNLLTETDDETPVYAAGVGSEHQMPLRTVSLDARTRVAHYYLGLTDDKVIPTLTKENREAIFLGQIAEIRRAHNFGDARGADDPSCYPGTVGRIGPMGAGHPQLHIVNPVDEITKIITEMLTQHIHSLSDKPENETIYWALRALTVETMKDFLEGKSIKADIPEQEWAPLRQKLIKGLGTVDEVFKHINEELKKRDHPKVRQLAEDEKVYVRQQLADISLKGVALNVSKKFEPTTTKKIDQVNLNDPFDLEEAEKDLTNLQNNPLPNITLQKLEIHRLNQKIISHREGNQLFFEIFHDLPEALKKDQENAVALLVKEVAILQQAPGELDGAALHAKAQEKFLEKYPKIISPEHIEIILEKIPPLKMDMKEKLK